MNFIIVMFIAKFFDVSFVLSIFAGTNIKKKGYLVLSAIAIAFCIEFLLSATQETREFRFEVFFIGTLACLAQIFIVYYIKNRKKKAVENES